MFSILENIADDWSQVLDIYAGSGALGIEALSRGAEWADFVESEPKCCAIIKENLEKTKLISQAKVYCHDAFKALSILDKEYSIILADPPYANASTGDFITQLAQSRLVGKKTMVAVSHSSRIPLEQSYAGLKLVKEQRHGDSCISFYQRRRCDHRTVSAVSTYYQRSSRHCQRASKLLIKPSSAFCYPVKAPHFSRSRERVALAKEATKDLPKVGNALYQRYCGIRRNKSRRLCLVQG